MAAVGYSIVSGGLAPTVALAKTVLGAMAPANNGLQCKGFGVSFDGMTAWGGAALIEVCYCTFTGNPPGTNSTSVTPVPVYGRRMSTFAFTAAAHWTTEPITITVLKEFSVAVDKGLFEYQFPLGQEPDTEFSDGLVLRVTVPQAVNMRTSMLLEQI